MRRLAPPPPEACDDLVTRALQEDLGAEGDLTSWAIVGADERRSGSVVARAAGTMAGLPLVANVFRRLGPDLRVDLLVEDGDAVPAGTAVAQVAGSARALLAGERTALNLLGWLSGIATATAALVDAVAGTRARILDTRKTTPTLRLFERYAVRCGGGSNHRFGLFDQVLIKDNHVVTAGSVSRALRLARAAVPTGSLIEVEIGGPGQLEEAIAGGADIVLLDNFTVEELRRAVALARGRVALEASGGVSIANIRAVAETGVDRISVGAITHSAPTLDVALDFDAE